MRALALLVLVCLAPLAAAQVPGVRLVRLDAEDPPPVRPLQGAVVANLTLTASCALVGDGGRIPIEYAVQDAPAWATVVVSPATDVADATACEGGVVTREATVSLTASDQAPAFRPTPVVVLAKVGSPGRQEETSATVNVTAEYFSIVDASLAEANKVARPGEEVPYVVKLSNLGNARTRVTFEVQNASEGIFVGVPPPVVLDSKQAGGNEVSTEVSILVRTRESGGFVNRVDVATVRILAEHAADPPRAGDGTTVSLILTTRTGGANGAPGPGVVLAALALALAAYVARRA